MLPQQRACVQHGLGPLPQSDRLRSCRSGAMLYANFREVVISAHRRVGYGRPYGASSRSKRTSRAPSPTTAWKPSSGSFVKLDQDANVVQPEEVSVLRDNLTRQL